MNAVSRPRGSREGLGDTLGTSQGRFWISFGWLWGAFGPLLGALGVPLGTLRALLGTLRPSFWHTWLPSLHSLLDLDAFGILLPAFSAFFGFSAFICSPSSAVASTLSHLLPSSSNMQALLHMFRSSVYLPVGHSGTCVQQVHLETVSSSYLQTSGSNRAMQNM